MRGLSGLLTVSASMIHLSYMKNEQQSITLEDLARMINDSFGDVTKKLDGVNARLDSLEAGQNRILSTLDNKVFRAEHDLLEKRVKVLEEKVGVSPTIA